MFFQNNGATPKPTRRAVKLAMGTNSTVTQIYLVTCPSLGVHGNDMIKIGSRAEIRRDWHAGAGISSPRKKGKFDEEEFPIEESATPFP